MSKAYERAMRVLDNATQQSNEPGFGTDDGLDSSICWKCRTRPAAQDSVAGVCWTCRAVLLGDEPDSDDRPLRTAVHTVELDVDWTAFAEAIARTVEAFRGWFTSIVDWLESLPPTAALMDGDDVVETIPVRTVLNAGTEDFPSVLYRFTPTEQLWRWEDSLDVLAPRARESWRLTEILAPGHLAIYRKAD